MNLRFGGLAGVVVPVAETHAEQPEMLSERRVRHAGVPRYGAPVARRAARVAVWGIPVRVRRKRVPV
ncbi:hypothetical protein [Parapedobacter sp. 2B3]|uniref:hypothetical protein n=1 Tax=Parapedobacter sp. 2B3 TaxID=3342381 RepID=UPI0035B63B17